MGRDNGREAKSQNIQETARRSNELYLVEVNKGFKDGFRHVLWYMEVPIPVMRSRRGGTGWAVNEQ